MREDIDRVLISRDELRARVAQLGRALSEELAEAVRSEGADPEAHGDRVVLLPVMTGAMVFAADLIREMPIKLSIAAVTVSSYVGESTRSAGADLEGLFPKGLGGRHVVIIDDILDSGRTLSLVQRLTQQQQPASVRTVVLLSKRVERAEHAEAEHIGFEIPDEFVVGYGLDFDGSYRNLPEIVTLRRLEVSDAEPA
ncbi:MAG: phosphoribosyltransferase family protein [Planctomycetota bacterium]